MDIEERQQELDKIAREVKEFKGLEIARNATNAVPGEGNANAEVMFIGEGPGYHEDQQGRPFVGVAGQLLEKSLAKIGLSRQDVYITNVIKYRPPENRDPEPAEIDACRAWLDRQIMVIEPKIIATLGRFSMAKFLGPQSITKIHGEARWVNWEGRQITVFPMFHPAAALRGAGVMQQFQTDFEKLGKILKEGIPVPEPLMVVKAHKSAVVQGSLF